VQKVVIYWKVHRRAGGWKVHKKMLYKVFTAALFLAVFVVISKSRCLVRSS